MILSLPTSLNLHFEPNRMDLVLSSPNGCLVYYQETIHIGYWNHCSSVFQFRWHVYVERQGKSHQRIVIDLKTQLVSYHWRISEKAKDQELILEANCKKFSRCLNTYFLCLLRMPDQSNMNETNLQYCHKNKLTVNSVSKEHMNPLLNITINLYLNISLVFILV